MELLKISPENEALRPLDAIAVCFDIVSKTQT